MERDCPYFNSCILHDNFNSHAHVERDTMFNVVNFILTISTHTLTWSVTISSCINTIEDIFQLTRSRGAWRFALPRVRRRYSFQLTRSRGAWQDVVRAAKLFRVFQLTRSRGAWQRSFSCYTVLINFNSHAHVERDMSSWPLPCRMSISTHTLTWSVTGFGGCFMDVHRISTHTLTWSVTVVTRLPNSVKKYFNSHAHVERDKQHLQE